jgi:cell division protein FtsB
MLNSAATRLTVLLLVLLGLLQAQLWWGRGSIPNVAILQHKIDLQKGQNAEAQRENERLVSELTDLKEGLDRVEERARLELGMVKPNEIFVQLTR